MKKVITWLLDKWLPGFITATFYFIARLYVDLPIEKKQDFFNFKWVNDILDSSFALKYTLLATLFLIIMTRIEKRLYKSQNIGSNDTISENVKPPTNHFSHFKSGRFGIKHTKWTWGYKWDAYASQYEIIDLKPSCKVCDIPMEILQGFHYHRTIECYKCRLEGRVFNFDLQEDPSDIGNEIIRRTAKNET
jgi:hypothetical protein